MEDGRWNRQSGGLREWQRMEVWVEKSGGWRE